MFIFKLTYKKPLEEVDLFLAEHRAWLDRMYAAGKFVASGPREPRVGGVILCNADSEDEAAVIMSQDPFYREAIADYEVICFHATKHSTANFEASVE